MFYALRRAPCARSDAARHMFMRGEDAAARLKCYAAYHMRYGTGAQRARGATLLCARLMIMLMRELRASRSYRDTSV